MKEDIRESRVPRLTETICQALEQLRLRLKVDGTGRGKQGGCTALQEAIRRETKVKVDRRKLAAIAAGSQNVKLSLAELRALDDYLGSIRLSLFAQPRLLEALAETNCLSFFVAAQPREQERRNDLSRWDIQAVAAMLRGLDRLRSGIHFDIIDVLHYDPSKRPLEDADRWRTVLDDVHRSAVLVGASSVSAATEKALSAMFEVTPLVAPQADTPLPFYFIRPRAAFLASAFAVDPAYVPRGLTGRGPLRPDSIGLRVADRVYVELVKEPRRRKSYGIMALQRRPSGQVWLTVAGLTGPATLAAAEAVTSELASERLPKTGVFWAAVEVKIVEDATVCGDDRTLGERTVIAKGVYP